jgi:hypothetical protein
MSDFYSQVKNPVWANAEHTAIDCEVDFGHLDDEFVPFTADPTDSMEYSKTIFDACVAGDYGPVAEYVPYVPTAEGNKQQAIQLLQATDWVNEPDVINTSLNPHLLNQGDFLVYRSQLRAIAVNPTAGNLDWPVKPQEQWS